MRAQLCSLLLLRWLGLKGPLVSLLLNPFEHRDCTLLEQIVILNFLMIVFKDASQCIVSLLLADKVADEVSQISVKTARVIGSLRVDNLRGIRNHEVDPEE